MSTNKPKLIVILGPTASGKSQLGVDLAQEFNGEIISADSRQVYRGLDIGSNKITSNEMKNVVHHLIDVASPRKTFTVIRFQKLAIRAAQQIIRRGRLPFLVGGSPFYLYAVTEGWQLPPSSQDSQLRKELFKKNPEELFRILKQLDPVYAKKIDPSNSRRLVRAIEIAKALGHVPPRQSYPLFESLFLGIDCPKDNLESRIIKRLDRRLEKGLIEEVKKIRQIPISWKRLEAFGLEYRWTARYLQNKIDYSQMRRGIIKDSLKLVRHQMNWFKKDQRINWIENQNQSRKLIQDFLSNSLS